MNYKINSDRTVAVATDTYWQPINKDTPRGVKVLLIHKQSNVTSLGNVANTERFWTHWAPLPKWEK